MRAVEPHGDGAVPHREARHVRADLGHGAGGLVADDVRHPGQVAPQPVERVATLDADRLHVDEDVARAAHGVGDVLVAEDVRRAGLVVHRCLHTRSYSSISNCLVLSVYHSEVWGSWVAIFPLAFLK